MMVDLPLLLFLVQDVDDLVMFVLLPFLDLLRQDSVDLFNLLLLPLGSHRGDLVLII